MGNHPACQSCGHPSGLTADVPGDAPQVDDDGQSIVTNPLAIGERAEAVHSPPAPQPMPQPKDRVYPRRFVLPQDGKLTVMMFGMTGAGKSALGNLIAGTPVFSSGDDTASVTNANSVLRFDAPDASISLLDTIGLGDTEIDQEKVIANIRDVAVSAVRGVDVLLFVMRQARITDDTIARLIYVTEYLWGSDCVLNLYVVVTYASRYLARPDEAKAWLERQASINWRFKHIYNLVDNNSNRFIFVDNPHSDSGEPHCEQRQHASREAVMRVLCAHPREVVPPFVTSLMRKAGEMVQPQINELEDREREVIALNRENSGSTLTPEVPNDLPKAPEVPTTPRQSVAEKVRKAKEERRKREEQEEARKRRAEAKAKRAEAEIALRKALEEVKHDSAFREEAVETANKATKKFAARYQDTATADPKDAAGNVGVQAADACKRMITSLKTTMRRMSTAGAVGGSGGAGLQPSGSAGGGVGPLGIVPSHVVGGNSGQAKSRVEEEPDHNTLQANEQILDMLVQGMKIKLRGSLEETFQRLAKKSGTWDPENGKPGYITPMVFQNYLNEVDPTIKRHQAGIMWRRGDTNCDGQMDYTEFCNLFGSD